MNWQEALNRAEYLLERAVGETARGGDTPQAVALATVARGYIELARAIRP